MVMGWAAFVHRFVGSCAGWGDDWAGLGWAGLWVRGFVGRSRVRVGELASSRRVWKVGHAINTIYYGEILGGSAQHPRNKCYIIR